MGVATALVTGLAVTIATPAWAGYTIYRDDALPSVLFIEFDGPAQTDQDNAALDSAGPLVISAPAAASTPVNSDSDTMVEADSDQNTSREQPEDEFARDLDNAFDVGSDRVRDVMIDEAIRERIFERELQ